MFRLHPVTFTCQQDLFLAQCVLVLVSVAPNPISPTLARRARERSSRNAFESRLESIRCSERINPSESGDVESLISSSLTRIQLSLEPGIIVTFESLVRPCHLARPQINTTNHNRNVGLNAPSPRALELEVPAPFFNPPRREKERRLFRRLILNPRLRAIFLAQTLFLCKRCSSSIGSNQYCGRFS